MSSRTEWDTHYDYIVVGAGTAGSVLAARLSEDPRITVLLLEAGSSETVVSNTPGLSDSLISSVMDWNFVTTSQSHSCLAMKDNKCRLASGRVMGGTSAIGRMIYWRPNPRDFDGWQNMGIKGWSWRDVFPFFIRAENQTDPELSKSGYYGVNGPLVISNSPEYNRLMQSWIFSAHLSGHPITDLNVDSLGSAVLQTNVKDGRRVSTASAYLAPIVDQRANLHIVANAYVSQVLIENKTAIGVKFAVNWNNYLVFARQEVLVSAGTINSAKLLMLSGIGPKEHLDQLNITVMADLPVGLNFHDHIGSYGVHLITNASVEESATNLALNQYLSSGKGPLSQSRFAATVLESADAMLLVFAGSPAKEVKGQLIEHKLGMRREVWSQLYGPYVGFPQFTIWPILLSPRSRGRVRLSSANPSDPPQIEANYLSEASDVLVLMQAMKEALRIANSRPMQALFAQPLATLVAGCEPYLSANHSTATKDFDETLFTDSYLQCVIRSLTVSAGDFVGTCRMGSEEASDGVVDSRLKVKGVDHLRVVDASVIPKITSSHTNAVTVMVAERASHLIKFDYRYHNLVI